MARHIVTIRYQGNVAGGVQAPDNYFDRIVKYIPTEIVAAWVAVSAIIEASASVSKDGALWTAFVFGLAITAAWIWRQTMSVSRRAAATQIAISCIAFAVWVLALGGPFADLGWYDPVWSALAPIGFTLVAGVIVPP